MDGRREKERRMKEREKLRDSCLRLHILYIAHVAQGTIPLELIQCVLVWKDVYMYVYMYVHGAYMYMYREISFFYV